MSHRETEHEEITKQIEGILERHILEHHDNSIFLGIIRSGQLLRSSNAFSFIQKTMPGREIGQKKHLASTLGNANILLSGGSKIKGA